MTNDKMYEAVIRMTRAMGAQLEQEDLAEKVIANPAYWCGGCIPFFNDAASLLSDLRERMDKGTTSASTLAAAKRIVKEGQRHNIDGAWTDDGWFILCDGYRAVRLKEDIACLPHIEKKLDVNSLFTKNEYSNEALPLPSIVDVKAHMAATSKKTPYKLNEDSWVNPSFLLDMLQVLPGCKARTADNKASIIYFYGETGDGILLPVRH